MRRDGHVPVHPRSFIRRRQSQITIQLRDSIQKLILLAWRNRWGREVLMLLWFCFLSLTSAGIRSAVIHSIHLQKQIHAVLLPGLGVPFSLTTSRWSKTDYDACVCMNHSDFNNWLFMRVKTAENNEFPSWIHFFFNFWEQASLRLSLWTFQTFFFLFFLLHTEQVLPSRSVWARLCRQQGLNKFNKIIATRQPVQILWFGILGPTDPSLMFTGAQNLKKYVMGISSPSLSAAPRDFLPVLKIHSVKHCQCHRTITPRRALYYDADKRLILRSVLRRFILFEMCSSEKIPIYKDRECLCEELFYKTVSVATGQIICEMQICWFRLSSYHPSFLFYFAWEDSGMILTNQIIDLSRKEIKLVIRLRQ